MIKEVIVVEGRDDQAAVKRAIEAETIATHGYGIRKETWALIEKAYRERGIIILTDPDFAGEKIRKRLTEKFPDSKQAYLPRTEAEKDGDIGIENALPKDILEALSKARFTSVAKDPIFCHEDLIEAGLTGVSDAADRRAMLGKALGIGYANSKVFLNRLNQFGITREEFIKSLDRINRNIER